MVQKKEKSKDAISPGVLKYFHFLMIWDNEQLMVINVKLVMVTCKHVHSFHAVVLYRSCH